MNFSKYIYIFLLNLSENNYGSSSAEARTDVLLKLQFSSVNMHKSWEGGRLLFFVSIKTSLEKSGKPPPNTHTPIRPAGLCKALGLRPSELGIQGDLVSRADFHFGSCNYWIQKQNIKTQKKNKGWGVATGHFSLTSPPKTHDFQEH